MLLATGYRQQDIVGRGWNGMGGFVGSAMGGTYQTIGGIFAAVVFFPAAVETTALAMREPDEGMS